jgi:hypothetical protein
LGSQSGSDGKMKTLSIIGLLVIPIITGILIRIIVRNKPKTELVIWGILMTAMLFFFIYSLILLVSQETPLFERKNLGNECSVISSAIFLIFGFIYYSNIRKSLDDGHDETITSDKNIEK